MATGLFTLCLIGAITAIPALLISTSRRPGGRTVSATALFTTLASVLSALCGALV